MTAPAAYVDGLSYALGERKALVEESAAAGRLVSAAGDLAGAGFRWHHVCEPGTTAYDLARAAVAPLAAAGRLSEVDALIYATCIPANGNLGDPAAFERTGDVKHLMEFPASRLQADFGFDDAVVIGLGQQACTSMLGSLRLARALLAAEADLRSVVCVTADRFPEGARYEQAYNLISDGAAACVVSRRPAGFRIVAAHHVTNGALGQASDDETVGSYFVYTHHVVRAALDAAGLSPAELAWVVPQNTNETAWDILARLIGVDRGRVWFPSLPDVGHVISSDVVVNLAALQDSGQLCTGDKVLVLMAGFGLNWQAVVLEAVGEVTR